MKKLVTATVLVATLGFGSSVFACMNQGYSKGCGDSQPKCGSEKNMSCGSHQKGGCDMMGNKRVMMYVMDTIMSLDLSKEQESKIDAIMKEHMDEVKAKTDIASAFSADKFDKKKFMEAQNTREIMVQSKADMLEKVYKVLTKEQKAELKAELDDFIKYSGKKGCGSEKPKGCGSK
ncbi:MAG: Spy/CpxP family protein refolding chaperone [Arcobacteraceae bacterium]|jgi:Spy/CpxP family protein refolding chaperone|nr:Spy/CpxP family protein refolding chaperone [Arcobacteraceae bacterium]